MEANWKPLESRLGRKRRAGFMYMGRVNGINLYEHGITRTYLNLDEEDVFIARKREELRQDGVSLLTLQIEPREMKGH